jgi:hypothetical protein
MGWFTDWLNDYWDKNKPMWPGARNNDPQRVIALPPEPVYYQPPLGPLFDGTPIETYYAPVALVFKMRFLIEKLRMSGGYDSPTTNVDRTRFFRELHQQAATGGDSIYGAISSEIEGKFVMTLDCDGTDEMLAVCHVLKSYYGLNYAVVVSSTNHYWVIADKVGTVQELLSMMEIMPGIDSRYVDCIRNKRDVVLRGFPKECMPIFPDSAEFADDRAARWYTDFKNTWQSEDMKHILRLKQLFKAIKEKKVADLAASPSFAV